MTCLYVVPTPIGNLEDITVRALRVLREVPLVLAEDTRHTRKLFSRYEISTPLLSYHQHNKQTRLDDALAALGRGDLAVVSNAGTPSIADPGFELIVATIASGYAVDVLPGASAVVTAVVAAAIPAPGFLFAGFLPRHASERQTRLRSLSTLPYSLVFYEAPHRLVTTLAAILDILGNRPMAVTRELTKLHQQVHRGSVADLLRAFQTTAPRGECTLVVSGALEVEPDAEAALADLRARRERGETRREATAEVIQKYGVGRNLLYEVWIENDANAG